MTMVQAIFYHKADSGYKDVVGVRYHFPKSYLSRVNQTLDDWIVYYGPAIGSRGRFYSGLAKVVAIEPDPQRDDHYFAFLADYLDFDRRLDYRENGGYEAKLVMTDGSINGGRSVQAVRLISPVEFAGIVEAGLSVPDKWPERTEGKENDPDFSGFEEGVQAEYSGGVSLLDRPIQEQIVRRPFRDRKFRQHVCSIYDRRCSFTRLRLINGGGRPEVEAAHIIPVQYGGNDSVQNGIALSGTVHWMFDRGLLSLSDDFEILRSRQLNFDVAHMLNANLRADVPSDPTLRPNPHYLSWHRDNVFKN